MTAGYSGTESQPDDDEMLACDHKLLKQTAASIVKRARAIGSQLKETAASPGREEDVEVVGDEPRSDMYSRTP